MGNWHISIEGVGSHHNGQPTDADLHAARFVKELRLLGQHVTKASFTHGGTVDLDDHEQIVERPATPVIDVRRDA